MRWPFTRTWKYRMAEELRLSACKNLTNLWIIVTQERETIKYLRERMDAVMGNAKVMFPADTYAEVISQTDADGQGQLLARLAYIRRHNDWPPAGWSMQVYEAAKNIPTEHLVDVEDMLDEMLTTVKAERERRQSPEKQP